MPRAIFIDRDGVINENRPDHVKSWDEFEFLPGVFLALRALAATDLKVLVVTNQAAINRSLVSSSCVAEIDRLMVHCIAEMGGRVDDVLCCPHRPDEHCFCRKPNPGLLLRAAELYDIDLRRSYLVGDAMSDIQAGQAVGCQSILVLTGRGLSQHHTAEARAAGGYWVALDLWEAVRRILRHCNYGWRHASWQCR